MENSTKKYGLGLLFLSAFWTGMIIAVAMEAIVRPKTPELQLLPSSKGLMFVITRTIFEFFQKVELLFCVALLFLSTRTGKEWQKFVLPFFVFLLCVLESFYFMPQLAFRAGMIYQGETLPPSKVHFLNLAAEGIKIILLLIIFIQGGFYLIKEESIQRKNVLES